MAKKDPYKALKSTDCELRNAAMVYLNHEEGIEPDFLHQITGLALSTVKNYLRKFAHLLEWAKEIFRKAKNTATEKAKEFWCYIDKIVMPNGETWCKIGQTTQSPEKRAAAIERQG